MPKIYSMICGQCGKRWPIMVAYRQLPGAIKDALETFNEHQRTEHRSPNNGTN